MLSPLSGPTIWAPPLSAFAALLVVHASGFAAGGAAEVGTVCVSALLAAVSLLWLHASLDSERHSAAEDPTTLPHGVDPVADAPPTPIEDLEPEDSQLTSKLILVRQCTKHMNDAAQKGDLREATRWMNHIKRRGLPPDRAVFTTMIHACAQAERQDEAARWFAAMEEAGFEADVVAFTAMVRACAKCGDSAGADIWFGRMELDGIEPTIQTWTIMLNAYALDHAKSETGTLELLNRMNRVGVEPTLVMFNTIIDNAARSQLDGEQAGSSSQRVESAEKWLSVMDSVGIAPNVVTFNTLLKACANSGQLHEAERILHNMKLRGIAGDVLTYNTMINASVQGGDSNSASLWLNAMKLAGGRPTVHTYTSLMALEKHHPDQALKWLDEAIREGITPDKFTYTAMLKSFATHGDIGMAVEIVNRMISTGVKPDVVTYTTVVDAYVNVGNLTDAMRWYNLMLDRGHGEPTSYTFCSLMKGYANCGDLVKVEELHNTMMSLDVEPNCYTYAQLMLVCKKVKRPDRTVYWFQKLLQAGIHPNSVLIRGACQGIGNEDFLTRFSQVLGDDLDHAEAVAKLSSINEHRTPESDGKGSNRGKKGGKGARVDTRKGNSTSRGGKAARAGKGGTYARSRGGSKGGGRGRPG